MTELIKSALEICKDRYFWEHETKWEDIATRMARENAKNETTDVKEYTEDIFNLINNMEFVPAGRILRNLGKLRPSTSNCNFLAVEDTIESIGDTIAKYLIISAYGGGTGLTLSTLRPKGAPLKSRGGESSGMLSFLEIFDFAGKKIETGGARRAAGIALCNVSHPEIIDFINAKIKHDKLNQFNISVMITNGFLDAVEADSDWEFRFAGKAYGTIKARKLWNLILNNMLEHSEPGIVNFDNLKKNNTHYFSPIEGVNPCGELPLENLGVCNLGSLVLPNFVANKNTNWQKLSKAIKLAVRFLDNIIDIAYYPIMGQEAVVKNARRIGLGTMGLADYLFMKEVRYGSEKSLDEAEKLYKFIRDESYIASVELAKEKGAFPKYDRHEFLTSSFVRKLPPKIRMFIKENSIRNAVLTTAPPTGTTSLIANVTSGIEPLPFKGYKRVDGVGERVYIHPLSLTKYDEEWFVDSYDLKPEEHLDMQITIQKYICSGVSKTILLPKNTTAKSLNALLLEYCRDLKGVTVYRDESREKQVFYKLSKKEIKEYAGKATSAMSEEDLSCPTGMCEV